MAELRYAAESSYHDSCEHGNLKEDCGEICFDCQLECLMHVGATCSGPVGCYGVDLECDCSEFRD